uniref:Uncharacterized protein n=1 Tax=Siphoviridae sp. ctUM413 TaxID=2827879 RepID=A0A8S5TAK6_9CAUD|nr:MAG TPA: hypothetical protein [Siphoviridae sp. ctUM413]DAW71008.1 MAG TPA: hypothetical protein [Caudoviricetes sp.]DAY07358.1 MAG TPA: hypothetical protein [Caudoviricetes sp.]
MIERSSTMQRLDFLIKLAILIYLICKILKIWI